MDIPFFPLEKINVLGQCPDAELIDLKEAFLRSRQDVYTAHRHDYFETFFFTQARGRVRVDFETYPLMAPGFLLVSPGQVHQWFLDEIPGGTVLRFDRQWVDRSTWGLGEPGQVFRPLAPLSTGEVQDFQALDHLLRRAFQRQGCAETPVLRSLVNLWLQHFVQIARGSTPAPPPGSESLCRRFLDLVEKSYDQNLQTQDMAQTLGTSESRLYAVLKKELGQSPGEILRQRILLEARRLLAVTDLGVSEISWRLGFEDPAYFSRYFHKGLGTTPLAYRQNEVLLREKSSKLGELS